MLNRKNTLTCAAAGAITLATSVAALAQSSATAGANTQSGTSNGANIAVDRLAIHYASLVGSAEQARVLIDGLGSGKAVALGETTFAGSGKTMGYVNINIALALASTYVAANVKAGQEPSALFFFSALDDVLERRTGGSAWGQIAKDLGFNLDQVLSASNTAQVATRAGHSSRLAAASQMSGLANANANG